MKNDDLAEIARIKSRQARIGSLLHRKQLAYCKKYADFKNGDIVKLTRCSGKVYKCRIINVRISDTCGGLCKINGFAYTICVHPTKDIWKPITRECYTKDGDTLKLWK